MRNPRSRKFIAALLSLAVIFSLLTVPAAAAGPDKIDVWDFGAEQLDPTKYNNLLTVEEINSWYPDTVTPGSEGNTIASFTTRDAQLSFSDGGKPTTHRLRTTNTALTRRDAKSLKDADGTVYNGYIYSNSGSNKDVYVSVNFNAGDTVTVVVGSNGGNSLINFEGPSGVEATQEFLAGGAKAQIMKFYPKETGTYKFYSTTEKLVIARIYRESAQSVTVSGSVNDVAGLSGHSVAFTNTENGAVTAAAVSGGKYSAQLQAPFTYDVSLLDANGYVITSESKLTVDAAKTFDVTVKAVDLVTVTGKITGLDAAALAKLELKFSADAIYIPVLTVEGDKYTAVLEKGVTYQVSAKGVNDYYMTSPSPAQVTYSADASADIAFAAKPTHKVTINATGGADLSKATLTFENLGGGEEGYTYTFTGAGSIALRDGVYSVSVTGVEGFKQKLTSDLVVNGGDVTKTVGFAVAEIPSKWDFSAKDFTGGGYTDSTAEYTYNGLKFKGGQINKTYLLMKAGTVSVPVPGPCKVVVSACYEYSFYFKDQSEASVGQKTGSTSKIESFTYDYAGAAGTVDITALGNSYLTSIEIVGGSVGAPYKATVTVGATGCDYTTVNDALNAVRKMNRPNGERVTISIQPGNYEEMLVVDVPNVTLANASAAPSTALSNKGVDIDPNAVRITWYYGHGYNYYSMDEDCKYNAERLAVNKENGRESFTNPGAGTNNGSYWNSSVVIDADGFEAKGIIFENSFNQYVSAKSLEDMIVPNGGQKEGATPRAELKTAGDTAVQDKAYVERAGALAITNNRKNIYFENCKFISRQDTLFGGAGVTAAFYGCQVVGSTDYIYGGMTAVFAKCDLVFNTSENNNDKGYITAPQQTSGRGFLMYNCSVTSTTPGVDTASEKVSKPGYFGRPWTANTGEAVFYETVVGTASDGTSLIHPDGWLNTLSGQSALCGEYNTHELTAGVDNSAARAAWAAKFTEPKLADGSPIAVETFLGSWNPFEGKDMTVSVSAPAGTGFVDVPADLYCAEAVTWAVKNNVTTGTSATTFSPAQTCTVKEIITLLWRANGSPASAAACPFQGVESYYTTALSWAAEKSLLGAETTSADQPCTRAMVCTYLWRSAGSVSVRHAVFTDVPSGADYAKAVSWAVETGVTNGTGAGGFSPDRVCSRGEIITFLYRSLVKSLSK